VPSYQSSRDQGRTELHLTGQSAQETVLPSIEPATPTNGRFPDISHSRDSEVIVLDSPIQNKKRRRLDEENRQPIVRTGYNANDAAGVHQYSPRDRGLAVDDHAHYPQRHFAPSQREVDPREVRQPDEQARSGHAIGYYSPIQSHGEVYSANGMHHAHNGVEVKSTHGSDNRRFHASHQVSSDSRIVRIDVPHDHHRKSAREPDHRRVLSNSHLVQGILDMNGPHQEVNPRPVSHIAPYADDGQGSNLVRHEPHPTQYSQSREHWHIPPKTSLQRDQPPKEGRDTYYQDRSFVPDRLAPTRELGLGVHEDRQALDFQRLGIDQRGFTREEQRSRKYAAIEKKAKDSANVLQLRCAEQKSHRRW
jgi:hypothetical protein